LIFGLFHWLYIAVGIRIRQLQNKSVKFSWCWAQDPISISLEQCGFLLLIIKTLRCVTNNCPLVTVHWERMPPYLLEHWCSGLWSASQLLQRTNQRKGTRSDYSRVRRKSSMRCQIGKKYWSVELWNYQGGGWGQCLSGGIVWLLMKFFPKNYVSDPHTRGVFLVSVSLAMRKIGKRIGVFLSLFPSLNY
jgi:hypothetical protein